MPLITDSNNRHVGTLLELRPLLQRSMTGLSPEIQDSAIALLQPHLEPVNGASEYRYVNRSLNEANVHYAIHNSDFELLKEATAVAAACYAFIQEPVAVVGGLVVLLFQYRRKRIKLTGERGVVLTTLKQAAQPGWSCEEVLKHLPFKDQVTVSEVQLLLESLKFVVKTDGTETALVRERDGLWLAVDV